MRPPLGLLDTPRFLLYAIDEELFLFFVVHLGFIHFPHYVHYFILDVLGLILDRVAPILHH